MSSKNLSINGQVSSTVWNNTPPKKIHQLTTQSKCFLIACIISVTAGSVIVILGVVNLFGAVGSIGFIVATTSGAIAAGIGLSGILWIAIKMCKKTDHGAVQSDIPPHLKPLANSAPENSQEGGIASPPEQTQKNLSAESAEKIDDEKADPEAQEEEEFEFEDLFDMAFYTRYQLKFDLDQLLLEWTEEQWDIPEAESESASQEKERKKQIAENKKRICDPIIAKLQEIYISEQALPTILLRGQQSDLDAIFSLILLTDQEVMNLELNQIKTFSSELMYILIQRLTLIDSKPQDQKIDEEGEQPCMTLNQLRSLKEKKQILDHIKQSSRWACLLSAPQIATLLSDPKIRSNQDVIFEILPVGTAAVKNYARLRLQALLNVASLNSVLCQLPAEHLRLLPESYFDSPLWEWSSERIKALFPEDTRYCDETDFAEIKRLIPSLKMATICTWVENLGVNIFEYFSASQLLDTQFPAWFKVG